MSALRVLLTSLSGQLGGMEMRLADEARFLADRGHECLLAPSQFPDRSAWLNGVLAESPRFSEFEFDPPSFFEEWRWHRINYLRAAAYWPRRLRRLKIDLAHVFYAWTFYGGTRVWLCHRANIPTVLSVHNAFPPSELDGFHRAKTAESFASVSGIYAVSESALQHFLATYGSYVRETTIVQAIPNFVDIDRFVPAPIHRQVLREALGIPDSALVVGSIGRLDTQKEPFQVLELFAELCAERDDVYLVFCGQGPLRAEVERRVLESPWGKRVRVLGFRRDVETIFPALDVHILLSRQEGFGISTAEAMACGIPVLATDVPGSRDVLNNSDAGILVPYGDSAAALAGLRFLFESHARRESMGIAGRRHATNHFSKAAWRERLGAFYERIGARLPVPTKC